MEPRIWLPLQKANKGMNKAFTKASGCVCVCECVWPVVLRRSRVVLNMAPNTNMLDFQMCAGCAPPHRNLSFLMSYKHTLSILLSLMML